MSGGAVRRDIGGFAGLVLGAARQRIPVVLDGFISTAGALIAAELNPLVERYIIASHKAVEIGHGQILERLMQGPLLDLRLG